MIWQIKQYLLHQWRAQGEKSLRSPFVFDFYQKVFKGPSSQSVENIARFAKSLKSDKTPIQRKDFGAGHGGKGGGSYRSSIAETARRSSRRKKEGRLLHNLVKHYTPQRMLELGSHLGVSTLYQASAMVPGAKLISLEGDPTLAALAREHLTQQGYTNAHIVEGSFAETLPVLELSILEPDYVFIDGDHRYEPTVDYVNTILPHMPSGGILIMDDIYWSEGMTRAWNEIRQSEALTVTVDLFYFGVCFVKMEQKKEHVVL